MLARFTLSDCHDSKIVPTNFSWHAMLTQILYGIKCQLLCFCFDSYLTYNVSSNYSQHSMLASFSWVFIRHSMLSKMKAGIQCWTLFLFKFIAYIQFPVNHGGISILDLTLTAQVNWTAMCVITGHLFVSLQIPVEFCSGDHTQLLTNARSEIWRQKVQ